MTEFQWGIAVWFATLAAFVCEEVVSKDVLGWAPWPSLSLTVWDTIKWWHVFAVLVTVILVALWGHFARDWSVWWLIAAGAGTVILIAVHLVEGWL